MLMRFIGKSIFNMGVRSQKKAGLLQLTVNTFMNGYHNVNYDINTNGEQFVLSQLSKFNPKTVFDVGANIGDWSIGASKIFKDASIYAFELAKPTFEILKNNIRGKKQIHINNMGLSDKSGDVEFLFYGAGSGNSTLILEEEIHSKENAQTLSGKVITGDEICAKNGIEHIDFLKVDVEGAEPSVLKGFSQMMNGKKIDVIQFEYGMANIYTKFLLKDYYEYFKKHGYIVGKLYPYGVKFGSYRPQDEDFKGPNYIAVSTNNEAIIQALSFK